MSTISDLFRAVSRVVTVTERITELGERLHRLEAEHQQTRERLARVETFVDMVQPAVRRRLDSSNTDTDSKK